jgi:hypothetical protein
MPMQVMIGLLVLVGVSLLDASRWNLRNPATFLMAPQLSECYRPSLKRPCTS